MQGFSISSFRAAKISAKNLDKHSLSQRHLTSPTFDCADSMGKKRKAGGKPFGEPKPAKGGDGSKLRVSTFEDVADSEDEFHLNQDKILLDEGPAAKRLRKWEEQGLLSN